MYALTRISLDGMERFFRERKWNRMALALPTLALTCLAVKECVDMLRPRILVVACFPR